MGNKTWSLLLPILILSLSISAIAVGMQNKNSFKKPNTNTSIKIILSKKINAPISALALRLIYNDYPLKSSPTLKINSDLTKEGKNSYPVKQITINESLLKADIALVNLSTEGYLVDADTLLATIDNLPNSLNEDKLELDLSTSKIILKSGEQLEAQDYIKVLWYR